MKSNSFNIGAVRLGFEAEAIFNKDYLDGAKLSTADALSKYIPVGQRIQDHLGQGVPRSVSYSIWNLVDDSSIVPDTDSSIPVEIVSPIMDYGKFASSVEGAFRCIRDYADTNESCGLHIGVSLGGVDLAEKLDVLKLIVFIGEAHVAKMFARFDNQYARLLEPFVSDYLGSFHDIEDHIHELVKKPLYPATPNVQTVIPWDKYFSINLTKIQSHNYIEFRLMGGSGYHKRADDVLAVARRVSWAVSIACDPDAHKGEYIKKLSMIAKKPETGKASRAVMLQPTESGYDVILQAPDSAHQRTVGGSVTLAAARTSDGALLYASSADHLPLSYRETLYSMLTNGVGGVRFSIARNSKRELFWVLEEFLEGVYDQRDLLYLITACPSILYVFSSASDELIDRLNPMLVVHSTRAAIRRALAKLDLATCLPLHVALGVFPTHTDPAVIANVLHSTGTDLSAFHYSSEMRPFSDSTETAFFLDVTAHLSGDLGSVMKALVSVADAAVIADPTKFPVHHSASLAQLLLAQCHKDFDLTDARQNYLSPLTDLMSKLTVDQFPLLAQLFELGGAYQSHFMLGLAHAMYGRNVDKSWVSCLQIV